MSEWRNGIDAVVVTGAGRGIGAAAAKHLASAGLPVLCISKSHNAQLVCQIIESHGDKASALIIDIVDPAKTEAAIRQWIGTVAYKRLGVVLAAGTTGAAGGLVNADLTDWLRTFQTNVIGNLAVVKALLPRMVENRFGRIVLFGGGGAANRYPLFAGYAASKAAVVRATENLHEELKDKGDFSIVCLAPGAIETDMLNTIREAGGEIRTLATMSEPLAFIEKFLSSVRCPFSGRFVHVRDNWTDLLDSGNVELPAEQWYLRRIEL